MILFSGTVCVSLSCYYLGWQLWFDAALSPLWSLVRHGPAVGVSLLPQMFEGTMPC